MFNAHKRAKKAYTAVFGTLKAQTPSTDMGALTLQAGTATLATSSTANLTLPAGEATNEVAAAPAPADTPASADALRDDLETNVLAVLRQNDLNLATKVNNLNTARDQDILNLATQINAIRACLRAHGLMA